MRQLQIRWQMPALPADAAWDLAHYQHSRNLAQSWLPLGQKVTLVRLNALLPDPILAKTAFVEAQGLRGDSLQHLQLRPHGHGSLLDVRLSSPLRPQSWIKGLYVPWQGPQPRWASLSVAGQEATLTLVLWDLPTTRKRTPESWIAACLILLMLPLQGMTHMVQPGENLSLIAYQQLGNGNAWPELFQANRHQIADPHWIQPGQRLVLPQAGGSRSHHYRVRPGDTLSHIAWRYWGSSAAWPRLFRANRGSLADPHWIQVGQILTIPGGSYRVAAVRRHYRPFRRPHVRRVAAPPPITRRTVPPPVVETLPPAPRLERPPLHVEPPAVPADPPATNQSPPPDPLFMERDPLFD